jgi:hypothetical protein
MFQWVMAILLVILLVGFLPVWPFNSQRTWGWWPSSIFGILFFIFIVALLMEVF